MTIRIAPAKGRNRGLIPLIALTAAAMTSARPQWTSAQETQTAGPLPAEDLPAHVARALGEIRDFSFNFDYEGFYLLVDHVRDEPEPSSDRVQPIDDWRVLLERPSDHRGRWVEVEGVVGRNRGYTVTRPAGRLTALWQLELGATVEQPIACTVILTQPADDVPLGAHIRVAGRFVMIRQYYDPSNRPRPAALIVGRGPTVVWQAGPAAARRPRANWTWLAAGLAVGLLAAWLLLRRATAELPRSDLRGLRASHPAPINLSQDLAAWAQQPQAPPPEEAEPGPPAGRTDQP